MKCLSIVLLLIFLPCVSLASNTVIDKNHIESAEKIRRYIVGTWVLPENPTDGEVIITLNSGLATEIQFNDDNSFLQTIKMPNGFLATYEGGWIVDYHGVLITKGTMTIGINQKPYRTNSLIHYIDQTSILISGENKTGYVAQYVKK